jgi:hypothetical protein
MTDPVRPLTVHRAPGQAPRIPGWKAGAEQARFTYHDCDPATGYPATAVSETVCDTEGHALKFMAGFLAPEFQGCRELIAAVVEPIGTTALVGAAELSA